MTAQNAGPDLDWNTADDINEPLNKTPGINSIDENPGIECFDPADRIRGFAGKHPGGVVFTFGDGSVRFINDSIEAAVYRGLSTIKGGEITNE